MKDPKKKTILLSLLSISGLFIFSLLMDKDTSITFSVIYNYYYYKDFFVNYYENDKVAKIIVHKNTGTSKTNVTILTTDGEKKTLILGNTDHFLEVLEKR